MFAHKPSVAYCNAAEGSLTRRREPTDRQGSDFEFTRFIGKSTRTNRMPVHTARHQIQEKSETGTGRCSHPSRIRAMHRIPTPGRNLLATESAGATVRANDHTVQVALSLEPRPMLQKERLQRDTCLRALGLAQQGARIRAPHSQRCGLEHLFQTGVALVQVPRQARVTRVHAGVFQRRDDSVIHDLGPTAVQHHVQALGAVCRKSFLLILLAAAGIHSAHAPA